MFLYIGSGLTDAEPGRNYLNFVQKGQIFLNYVTWGFTKSIDPPH